MVYPAVYTIIRSFFGQTRLPRHLGRDRQLQDACSRRRRSTTAIKNNAIWVAVVPAFVTAIGLVFAVLTERVRWAVAFKTVVFLPMAISAFATGVTWRIMYQQDPNLGAVNALGTRSSGALQPAGRALVGAPVDAVAAAARRAARSCCKTPLASGRRRAARPDRHRAGPRAEERGAGGAAGARSPATSSAPSGATSSRAAASPASSRRASSGCPGVTVELARRGRQDGAVDDDRSPTGRSTSRRSPPGRTRPRSARRPSRSRSPATPGSGRT